jgi:hypothetical protein
MSRECDDLFVAVLALPVVESISHRRREDVLARVLFATVHQHAHMARDHYEPIFHILFDWVKERTGGRLRLFEMPLLCDTGGDQAECAEAHDDAAYVSVVDVEPWPLRL